MSEEDHEEDFGWSFSKMMVVLILFIVGTGCIAIGITPFVQSTAEAQDLANIGFMALIVFFMFGLFKIKEYGRFVFWAACFTLILYTNIIFLFYKTLF